MELSGLPYSPDALLPVTIPLNIGLTGPQSRFGCFGEDKTFLLLPRIEPQFLGRLFCCLDYYGDAVKMAVTDFKASSQLAGLTEKLRTFSYQNITECRG
jgi:hypothetical protein